MPGGKLVPDNRGTCLSNFDPDYFMSVEPGARVDNLIDDAMGQFPHHHGAIVYSGNLVSILVEFVVHSGHLPHENIALDDVRPFLHNAVGAQFGVVARPFPPHRVFGWYLENLFLVATAAGLRDKGAIIRHHEQPSVERRLFEVNAVFHVLSVDGGDGPDDACSGRNVPVLLDDKPIQTRRYQALLHVVHDVHVHVWKRTKKIRLVSVGNGPYMFVLYEEAKENLPTRSLYARHGIAMACFPMELQYMFLGL